MRTRPDDVVVALGIAAVAGWLLSYSWLLGAVFPMPGLEFAVSPWLVAEIASVAAGTAAVAVALAGSSRTAAGRMPRRTRTWAVLGGAAATLAALSLAA